MVRDSDSEDSDDDNIASHEEIVEKMKNVVVRSPQASSVTKVTISASNIKFKNAKPNPETHLNVDKNNRGDSFIQIVKRRQ